MTNNQLKYEFTASEGLKQFFSGKQFVIEYPMDITQIPEGVLAIPFVSCVLPIIWLTDSELCLSELDQAFYECIPNVKSGYTDMFPESYFGGQIKVGKVVECDRLALEKCASFFSGGLDATQTLVSHLEEKPHLISIWGSDIRFDNEEGWRAMHSGIAEVARRFDLPDVQIRTNFREFDDEGALHQRFSLQLKDGWWHGVKHGIALLGHAAPYAYIMRLKRVYIGSSHCPADGVVRCASNPAIDNHVRFADCQVVHDGFEFNRQDKVGNVVRYVRSTGNKLTLHVCWQTQTGKNCCRCEKCYRTIASIMAEGEDPKEYGFELADATVSDMRRYIVDGKVLNANLAISGWMHIHNKIVDNKKQLRKKAYWKHIKWIAESDFANYESIKMPLLYRMRIWLSQFRFYQMLHQLKEQ